MAPTIRGPIEITPAFGSRAVAQNAVVRVLYSQGFFATPGARTPEESFRLLQCNDGPSCLTSGREVSGTVSLARDTLVFVPDALLEDGVQYLALAAGIDQSFEAEFRVLPAGGASSVDLESPVFGPVTSFTATSLGPSCEAPDGGFRVDVSIQPAVNELAGADVEYLLFLTRGAGIEAPELRARARGVPSEVVMAFVLSPEESTATICFTVQAIDGAGNIGELSAPVCEDPVQGNFFEPLCNANPDTLGRREGMGVRGWGGGAVLGGLLLFALKRSRRRQRGGQAC